MKLGLRLLYLHADIPRTTRVVEEADRLGFESVWLPEHLVLPADVVGSPETGHPSGVPSDWPWFDPFVYLAHLGARTRNIRLGTNVYVLALRSPFVSARSIQTLDAVSEGRAEIGVGAGWVRGEWEAVGVELSGRGRRLNEAIAVCRRLWTDDPVEYHGEFFDFEGVRFLPKPVQPGGPPLHIGGQSDVALRRAARLGDGWIGQDHSPASVRPLVAELRRLLEAEGRTGEPFEITVRSEATAIADLAEWEDAGVSRLLITPWAGGGKDMVDIEQLLDGLHAFAEGHGTGEAPTAPLADGRL